jgi:hypothetical protein
MADPSHDSDAGVEPRASPELARDLGALFAAPEQRVPAVINERILSRARAQIMGQSRRRRPPLLRWAGAAAAAAAVVLVCVWLSVTQPRPQTRFASAVPADVDGNGQVDILDALVLARQVDAHQADAIDVNHDGVANRGDVDAVAMLAVSLQRGGAR